MHINLICAKVKSLLKDYIQGSIDIKDSLFIQEHLKICVNCRHTYQTLKRQLSEDVTTKAEGILQQKEDTYYMQNLSAYYDNELSFDESVRMKKYLIKTPSAREELKKLHNFRILLQKVHKSVLKKANFDYSKTILKRLDKSTVPEQFTLIQKFAAVILLILFFTVCLCGALYFSKQGVLKIAHKISHLHRHLN